MDDFSKKHLEAWLQATVHWTEIETVRKKILALLEQYPELLETHSWPEMRELAERNF